jgi:predicted AAA+ superfamily ATPase
MFYKRYLNILKLLDKKSVILLGPRQTGKSSLALQTLPDVTYINLAAADVFRELSARPELVRQRLMPNTKYLIVDEAQRIPALFDEVQIMLDRNKELRILLTGSSARKLRRTGINLLPGRVWNAKLFPLIYPETGPGRIQDRFSRGSLPGVIDSGDYQLELKNYVGTYLDEEVRAEGLVRGIGDFSRFLSVAALSNGQQLNFTNISSDTGIKVNTVRSYFEILEDTLIGSILPSYRRTSSRKAVASPKFYLFDIGVVNALLNRFEITAESELYGSTLEHFIFLELTAYLSYHQQNEELSYWRTHSQFEVDFIIGDSVAIEIKSNSRITERHEKGIQAFSEDVTLRRKIIVCNESAPRISDTGIEIMPVEYFLQNLWNGEILGK